MNTSSVRVICLLGIMAAAPFGVLRAATIAELPRVYVDTSMPTQSGLIIHVANNCLGLTNCQTSFQAALNTANPGDTIVLKAGDTFPGPFTLPYKSNPNNEWILIESSNLSALPSSDTRVSLADAPNMPTITGGQSSPQIAIETESKANYYRFVGIRFIPNPNIFATALIRIGNSDKPETTVAALPHHIIFDRVIVSGDPTQGGRRGFMLNGRMQAIINSYINGWKEKGADSQAISGWNGTEGYKIVNNYLEAAGENISFGGSTSSIAGQNPSDIEIRSNYLHKPLSLQNGSWVVKNLFELKTGERVLFEDNILDGSWAGDQSGKAINLKSTNQAGSGPGYYHTGDVTIRYNIIRNMGAFISLVGIYPGPAVAMNNIDIHDNIIEKINVPPYVGDSFEFIFGASNPDMDNISITHNTFVTTGSLNAAFMMDSVSATNVNIKDNIFMNGQYGIKTGGKTAGTPSLDAAFTNYSFANNALIGGGGSVGTHSISLADLSAANFADITNSDYRITSGPLRGGASDGTDVGANIALVTAKTKGVINGNPTSSAPPPVSVTTPVPTKQVTVTNVVTTKTVEQVSIPTQVPTPQAQEVGAGSVASVSVSQVSIDQGSFLGHLMSWLLSLFHRIVKF